ncbi:MAG: EAL domain-containing protein [Acidimicrobiia bacterium]
MIGGISSFSDIDGAVRRRGVRCAARHDSLTGLANRAGLFEEIERALASDRRTPAHTALLVIDLDHFKDVNDSLGHPVGDRLLTAAAQRLRDCVRAGEFLARPGGDEFTVVMRGLDDPATATQVAQRIVESFRAPFTFADTELFTTASVGIVYADPVDNAVTPDTLLRDGDSALYHAKEHGRDQWTLFNNELRETLEERLRMERELRGALDLDQFELYYQPEIDLNTGALTGVEALLRWHHPSGELYPAARFIEVAEDTGLILQLGTWALRTACRQAADWAARFPEHPIVTRFNISSLQLSESRLLDELDDVLATTEIEPSRLCVEITENALLRSTHVVTENLHGLRRRGLCLAFDDFGAGTSSLASLREFPVDRLTLDREFIADITTDKLDRNIVAGVLALAHRLSLPVTAGGIEHAAQAELLTELGCERAQGFLYAPALPAAQIEEMLSGR